MTISRWDPFKDLNVLQDRMNRLFDDAGWSPAVDIFETQNEIIVKAEIPGVDKNDVSLHLENNVLTVKGMRRFENETKEENYHRIERAYGAFSRAFAIPVSVDEDKIRADYRDGILTIALPKKQQGRPKQIQITE